VADLAERRRSQTELRIALWTLVLTVVTASALVSRSYGHLEEAVAALQVAMQEHNGVAEQQNRDLRSLDQRVQRLEDLPEHRRRLNLMTAPAPVAADDTAAPVRSR